jgi:hypothetical protein
MLTTLHEYVGNLHIHTPYSDGAWYHAEIAEAALAAGLDWFIVTDHNVWVDGVEGYYGPDPAKQVLLLVGEEVHDVRRDPQANHLLVLGADKELAQYAPDTQELIDQVVAADGLCFIAHPHEKSAPLFDEGEIPWVNWDVSNYTGLEIWNYMSEFKGYLESKLAALRSALHPERVISGPYPETLAIYDRLLSQGKLVRIVGGSDVHGHEYSMGPIHRVIFPYEYVFRCVNTHILARTPMLGDLEHDKGLVLNALRVGYDLPAPTEGFRFSAQGHGTRAIMGERIRLEHGVTLQIVTPRNATIRLLYNGEVVTEEPESNAVTYIASKPGIYRVEAYIHFQGKLRGWIFSNPIFVV